jgi:hypothetical protein
MRGRTHHFGITLAVLPNRLGGALKPERLKEFHLRLPQTLWQREMNFLGEVSRLQRHLGKKELAQVHVLKISFDSQVAEFGALTKL